MTAADLSAAVSALCEARDEAATTPSGARDTFYVVAHQRLHSEAAALDRSDRPAAGRLLIDMQRVEADLAATPTAPSLAGDLATLATTAADGLGRIRVQRPSCASA